MSEERPKEDLEKNASTLTDEEAEGVVGGTGLSVANLQVRGGGAAAATENGTGTQKLYKITHDGGSSEGWGPVLSSG